MATVDSIVVDGTNDYLSIVDAGLAMSNCSVVQWVYPLALANTTSYQMFILFDATGVLWEMFVTGNSASNDTATITAQGNGFSVAAGGGVVLELNTWQMLGLTIGAPSGGSAPVSAYHAAQGDVALTKWTGTFTTRAAGANLTDRTAANRFAAAKANMRVCQKKRFHTALSDAEMLAQFTSEEPVIAAWADWRMAGQAAATDDSSGNGRVKTLTGAVTTATGPTFPDEEEGTPSIVRPTYVVWP